MSDIIGLKSWAPNAGEEMAPVAWGGWLNCWSVHRFSGRILPVRCVFGWVETLETLLFCNVKRRIETQEILSFAADALRWQVFCILNAIEQHLNEAWTFSKIGHSMSWLLLVWNCWKNNRFPNRKFSGWSSLSFSNCHFMPLIFRHTLLFLKIFWHCWIALQLTPRVSEPWHLLFQLSLLPLPQLFQLQPTGPADFADLGDLADLAVSGSVSPCPLVAAIALRPVVPKVVPRCPKVARWSWPRTSTRRTRSCGSRPRTPWAPSPWRPPGGRHRNCSRTRRNCHPSRPKPPWEDTPDPHQPLPNGQFMRQRFQRLAFWKTLRNWKATQLWILKRDCWPVPLSWRVDGRKRIWADRLALNAKGLAFWVALNLPIPFWCVSCKASMFYKDIWQKSFQAGDRVTQTIPNWSAQAPHKFAASCNSLHYTVTTPTLVSTNMYKPSPPSPSISFIHIQHLAGQCETYPNDHPVEYPIQIILWKKNSFFRTYGHTIHHHPLIYHPPSYPIPSRFLKISHPPLMFFGPLPEL